MAQTKISNLFEPQLLADAVKAKLGDAIKFTPVAHMQDLSGQAGSVISLPKFEYIGDAVEVAEGQPIPVDLLTQTSVDVQVKKVAKAIELTDEAVMNGYGDAMGEAETQIVRAIANGVEKEVTNALAGATLVHDASTVGAVNGDVFLSATALFGEDQEGEKFIFANPKEIANVRKDEGYKDGKLYEANVIFTNRVAVGEAFLMKQGGLGIFLKSDVGLEEDRNILTKSTVVSADQHFVAYARDLSKIVKINLVAPTV
jgi:N4-gp56 family major capsid protein